MDDGAGTVYLWQGWWPEEVAGWAPLRWRAEWRCGLETALQYGKARGAQSCMQVWAGMEPSAFTALFPTWRLRPDVALLQPGRQSGDKVPLNQLLPQLTRTLYSLEELRTSLPPGADPRCLEAYLPTTDFQELLGITKEDFYTLPFWKQIKLKQAAGLF
ncbi:SVIL [Cordylochernes scorpioides]|uniref:SVIL n=1 Tax=Cordylochernes scorpioides TaxID=51811 RepID=A0ABY6KGZ4_9ARAC|nr:SVIL [Cordylochernes scorpioides]